MDRAQTFNLFRFMIDIALNSEALDFRDRG